MRYLTREEQQRERERRQAAEFDLERDNAIWRSMAEDGRRRADEQRQHEAQRRREQEERRAARQRAWEQRASQPPAAPTGAPAASAFDLGRTEEPPAAIQEGPAPAPQPTTDQSMAAASASPPQAGAGSSDARRDRGGRFQRRPLGARTRADSAHVRRAPGKPKGARTHRYHPDGDLRLFLLEPPDADPEVATRRPVPDSPHFANKAAAERWLRARPALLDGARVEMLRVYSRFAVKARLRPDLDPIRSKNGNERKKLDATARRFNRACAAVDGSDPGPYSFCDDFMSKSPCPIDSEAKLEEEPKLVPGTQGTFDAAPPIKRRNRNLRRETWRKLTQRLEALETRFNVERAVLARARERGESQELQLSIRSRMRELLREMRELQGKVQVYSAASTGGD